MSPRRYLGLGFSLNFGVGGDDGILFIQSFHMKRKGKRRKFVINVETQERSWVVVDESQKIWSSDHPGDRHVPNCATGGIRRLHSPD